MPCTPVAAYTVHYSHEFAGFDFAAQPRALHIVYSKAEGMIELFAGEILCCVVDRDWSKVSKYLSCRDTFNLLSAAPACNCLCLRYSGISSVFWTVFAVGRSFLNFVSDMRMNESVTTSHERRTYWLFPLCVARLPYEC